MARRPDLGPAGSLIVHIICHYDDTNSSGGLDKQARLLTRRLRSAGENVIMLTSTRKLKRAAWTQDDNVPVRFFWTYGSPQLAGRHMPAALIWAAQLLIWIALNRSRIQAIHIHQLRIHAFVAALAQKWFKVPTVMKSATGGAGADINAVGSRKYFGSAGRRFLARHGSIFIATTQSISDDLVKSGVEASRVRVIPNGMSLPEAQHSRPDVRARRGVFLGRLAVDKNVVKLAEAATDLSSVETISVDFYGKGVDKERLTGVLDAHQGGAATYRGFVNNPTEILGAYGWLVLPSEAEGLSNAMIESMANGVVPLVTRVSGCVDHVEEGVTGYFFDGVSQEELRAGLAKAARTTPESWRAMSERVEQYARNRFDIAYVVQAYRDLYAQLNASRTGKGQAA